MKQKNNRMATLYIVRHGQSEANIKEIMDGQGVNASLSAEGQAQASQVARDLRDVHFDAVVSSDLARARQTAEIIALERNLAVTTTELLRERFFGEFEGKTYKEFDAKVRHLIEQAEALPLEENIEVDYGFGIETHRQVFTRFNTYLREVATAYLGQTVLVATHGSIFRFWLIHIGWATFAQLPVIAISNTAYAVVESDGVDFFVKDTRGINLVNNG